MHSYPNQPQQNYPSNYQPFNQHGEFEQNENLNKTQLLHNSTGEHKETNYNGMFNYPSHLQHIRYPSQDHQLNQQGELEHSAGEHHHINYHGNRNYPSHFQPFNHSIPDQKFNQQGELEKLGNLNQTELHSFSGEHHQPQHNGTVMHPSQFQQLNYLGQDQQHNHQGEKMFYIFIFDRILNFSIPIPCFYAFIVFDMLGIHFYCPISKNMLNMISNMFGACVNSKKIFWNMNGNAVLTINY